jgi:hypothetical protein
MTTKELYFHINQIYNNKHLNKLALDKYDLNIELCDIGKYNCTAQTFDITRKSIDTNIFFTIDYKEDENDPLYLINYKLHSPGNRQIKTDRLTNNQTIHPLIKKLISQIIRDIKIENILNDSKI